VWTSSPPTDRNGPPKCCGVFWSPCLSARPVVLAPEVPPLYSRSTSLNRGPRRARSTATLLAGRDRGNGRQKSLVLCSSEGKPLVGRGCGPARQESLAFAVVISCTCVVLALVDLEQEDQPRGSRRPGLVTRPVRATGVRPSPKPRWYYNIRLPVRHH